MGLDKLFELLIEFIDLFRFWQIVDEYQQGVRLRLGRFKEVVGPGWHWRAPFGIDHYILENVMVRTSNLSPQGLVTKDGKTVNVSGILRWSIRDIRKAIIDVDGLNDATRDIAYVLIAESVTSNDYDTVRNIPHMTEMLTRQARKTGWRYGIEVEQLALSDISITKNFTHVKPNG